MEQELVCVSGHLRQKLFRQRAKRKGWGARDVR
jgi:hypothetical protein